MADIKFHPDKLDITLPDGETTFSADLVDLEMKIEELEIECTGGGRDMTESLRDHVREEYGIEGFSTSAAWSLLQHVRAQYEVYKKKLDAELQSLTGMELTGSIYPSGKSRLWNYICPGSKLKGKSNGESHNLN